MESIYAALLLHKIGSGITEAKVEKVLNAAGAKIDKEQIVKLIAGLKDTDVEYGRLPGWAYFKAGDFDFMVVGVHLHWSNLDKRTAGVADLLAWLKEFADRPETEERDLIIVGDMNRFGD